MITLVENLPWLWLVTPPPSIQSWSKMVIPHHCWVIGGMDTLGNFLNWGLPCSWLKAVSLYIMGNLGLKILVNVVEAVLQQELSLELDPLSESLGSQAELVGGDDSVVLVQGLTASISSSVLGVAGTG